MSKPKKKPKHEKEDTLATAKPPDLPQAAAVPNLYELRLGAGDKPGFSIAFKGDHKVNMDPAEWLSKGYAGVRFIGEGIGVTHLLAEDGYHDSTVFVGPHNGIVQLENLSLHVAQRKGLHMGLAGQAVLPNFMARLRNVEVVADGLNPSGGRRVWGVFGYQCDWDLEDVVFQTAELAEHASYPHGFARYGLRWHKVRVEASGAEGCKVRSSPTEVMYVKGAKIQLSKCSFKSWNQPWSWRGGAGCVFQGTGCDILAEECVFWGRADAQHCRAFMVDDGGGDYVGRVVNEYANGFVIISGCGFTGGPGGENFSPIIRVGPLAATSKPTARGVLITGCGIYGERLAVQLDHIPTGKLKVNGCNTPALKEYATAAGFNTEHEAYISSNGLFIPVSKGLAI